MQNQMSDHPKLNRYAEMIKNGDLLEARPLAAFSLEGKEMLVFENQQNQQAFGIICDPGFLQSFADTLKAQLANNAIR